MVEHLHILKPFEGIGQDIPLSLGIGIAALGVDAVGLLPHQPSRPACLVEFPEVGDDVAEFHPTFVVGEQQHRHKKHRLVRVTHVYLQHRIQKQSLTGGIVDQCVTILLGIFLKR